MLYFIQITIYAALLYGVYIVVLKNRTAHSTSRAYLLLCAFMPVVLPLMKLRGVVGELPVSNRIAAVWLPEVIVGASKSMFALGDVLMIVYVAGMGILMLRIVMQYVSFRRFVKQHKYEVLEGNVKLLLATNAGPGSFLQYVFLPGGEVVPEILEHELAHIRLKHSVDIIFLKLLQLFFWPNAMLHFIVKELKMVHEFQADEYAATNRDTYITTLLNDAFTTNRFTFSHTYFYHPLKRRIMILQKAPQGRQRQGMAILKTGVTATLLLSGIIYLQSCKEKSEHKILNKPVDPKITHIEYNKEISYHRSGTNYTKEPTILVGGDLDDTVIVGESYAFNKDTMYASEVALDVKPEPGVDIAQFLMKNLEYPKVAKEKGMEGKVIVGFIITDKGDLSDIEIVTAPDLSMSNEALRVVKLLPKWKPGMKNGKPVSVSYHLPIAFRLK